MHRQSQLLYTVFAGSNNLDAPGVPHLVLRKMVHEKYHTSTAGAPVNDIAVFRVRIYAGCIIIVIIIIIIIVIIIIILYDNCRLSLPVGLFYRTNAGDSTDLPEVRRSGNGKVTKR
jgi:hypothetical protein